ncbi:hypothetical protein GEMRC1_013279 [Eukaryota sp. GEM-RC1]
MLDDTTKSHLSSLWQNVCSEWAGRIVCDSYVYAKQFIVSKCSKSLRSLSWFLLNESKGRLHDEFHHLLPIDCVDERPQEVVNYSYKDSVIALKLFLLFQSNKIVRPTFVTHKTTLKSIVKHFGLTLLLDYYAQLVHKLRMHTSYCLKLFLLHMDKNGEKLPLITRKEVEHIQTLLRNISAEHHEIKLCNRGSPPAFNEHLKNFVLEEYKQVMLDNGGIPLFPAAHSSRLMAMVGETIKTNLDTNIKMRYAQYIDKFINVYFQKTDQEEKMSKKRTVCFSLET